MEVPIAQSLFYKFKNIKLAVVDQVNTTLRWTP